ncbi:MAG: CARDB domain-containing protein, partial [Candidatus Woesearchaeota archaeon]
VDPLNKIKEADETNNTFVETLTPGYGLTTLGGMYNDFSQKIVINIQNNGNFDLASETNGVTTYKITNTNGTTLQNGSYIWQDLPDQEFFRAGYSSFIEIDNTLATGTYTIKTCVDTENNVKEINENDNCLTEELSIPE